MGLFGGGGGYSSIEISDEWVESGALSPNDDLSNAIYVKPHEDDGGIDVGVDLLTSLHNPKINSKGLIRRKKQNVSDELSFEITYSREAMGFKFASKDHQTIETVETQLESLLPNSDFERQEPQLLDFRSGRHVSACELTLRDYTLRPLKHKELEGFNTDPLGQIAAQMIGLVDDQKAPAEVAVQTVLKPADRSWTQGVNGEGDINTIAANLEEENIVNAWHPTKYRSEEPSDLEKKTAKLVRNQSGRHGWWFNIRIIAVSEDPEEAKRRVRETAGMYRRFYLSETEQGFEAMPRSGKAIKACVEDAVQRNYVEPQMPMVKSENEVAGFVHIPDGDFSTRDLERSTTKGDEGVPPTLPDFKHIDQTGYTEGTIPRRSWEQQNSDDYPWDFWAQMESPSDYIDVNAHEYGMEAREAGRESDVFAGAYPRAMIENAQNEAEQPYWIGLDGNNKPVPILHNETFRHLFVTGQTGTGKSTFVLNRLQQHAMKDHGFAFVDPGGEDCYELMKMLPEDRLDDVVFIDITNSGSGDGTNRHIGFNFLETHNDPDEEGFDGEVEGIVSDILPLLEADEFQRMKGVASNIIRGLIRGNYADTGYTYTLIDMFYILANEEGRQRYSDFVREEEVDTFLETYADEVAELEDSDLEPLIRRLQKWIENPMIRPIVSERNPEFSIAEVVEENKILVIKCDTSRDVRQMVSSTITRKIWSVVTARPSRTEKFLMGEEQIDLPPEIREASAAMGGKGGGTADGEDGTSPKANADAGDIHIDDLDLSEKEIREHDDLMIRPNGQVLADTDAQAEHDPYYLVIDELHSVLSEESQVEQMLAEARKKRLGLILLTQQTVQLNKVQRRQIMSNCSTLMAFNPGQDGSERGAIAKGFSGLNPGDLGVDNYHAWTMVTDKEGALSQPFQSRMFPQYPPKRGLRALRGVIESSLDEYGTEIKTNEQIQSEIPDQFTGMGGGGGMGIAELLGADGDGASSGGGAGGTPGGSSPAEDVDAARRTAASEEGKLELYESIHIVQIRADALGQFVPSEEVKAEWQRRTGDMGYDSIASNYVEQDPYIQRTRQGGDVMLNLTAEGMEAAGLTHNTGSSASGGKDHHRMVLEFSYQAFTKLGMETWLPEQEGGEEADGMADLPIDPSEADNFRDARNLEQKAREQLIDAVGTDAVMDLTDGRHISIEAETSTMQAPEQTLTNLRKALDTGRFCVFACKDEWANEDHNNDTFYWPKRGEKIIYDTYRDGRQTVPNYDKKTFARDIDDDGNRTFYNRKKGFFHIGDEDEGVYVLRKRTQAEQDRGKTTEIYWEEEGDGVALRDRGISDGDGGYVQEPQTLLRFDSQEAVANVERADVEAYYSYDSSEEVYIVRADGAKEEYETEDELLKKWSRFYPPFLPDVHFPREPDEDDWAMVVFPDDDNPEYDEPVIYHQGETRPLLPEEIEMPDAPDAGEIEYAEGDESEGEGEGEPATGEGVAADQQAGANQPAESEAVTELADAVVEASDVSHEQAVVGARSIVDTPMGWDSKVDTATTVAQRVTSATDGGADTASPAGQSQDQTAGGQPASADQPDALDEQDGTVSPDAQNGQQATSADASETAPTDASQATGEGESGQQATSNASAESSPDVDPTNASAGVGGFSRVGDERPGSSQSSPSGQPAQGTAQSSPNSAPNHDPNESAEGASTSTAGSQPQGEAQPSGEATSDANPEPEVEAEPTVDVESSDESTTEGEVGNEPREEGDSESSEAADVEAEPSPGAEPSAPENTPDETAEDGVEADAGSAPSTSEPTSHETDENGDSPGDESDESDADSDENTRTFADELDERVANTDEESKQDRAKKLIPIYKEDDMTRDEAYRKAQRHVFGEVREQSPSPASEATTASGASDGSGDGAASGGNDGADGSDSQPDTTTSEPATTDARPDESSADHHDPVGDSEAQSEPSEARSPMTESGDHQPESESKASAKDAQESDTSDHIQSESPADRERSEPDQEPPSPASAATLASGGDPADEATEADEATDASEVDTTNSESESNPDESTSESEQSDDESESQSSGNGAWF